MSSYNEAFEVLMKIEGETFENDPLDEGGPTKFGITKVYLADYYKKFGGVHAVSDEDIKSLYRLDAYQVHRIMSWDSHIVAQEPATLILLARVHLGSTRGAKASQRALRASGHIVEIDGIMGPLTRGAINATPSDVFGAAMRGYMAGFYVALCAAHHEKRQYLEGFLDRASWPW